MEFDDIIVGAGSSGAVLATRLSEDTQRKVLLIEAGPDYAAIEKTPASLLDGRWPAADHDWGYTADMVPGRPAGYPRGKVTGGCSAVNVCLALRGMPVDYDEWATLGNPAWSWSQVLPFFARLEDDRAMAGTFHGTGGPTPIRRYTRAELGPAQKAFVDACVELGFPEVQDQNHPAATGVGSGAWNLRGESQRVSTAIAYLLAARQRPNLTIRPDCLVDRVLFDGKRAIGVELEQRGGREQLFGRRITLSAGAIGSPAILLRSGIGPEADLRALGIEPLVASAGVGANLIEHSGIGLGWAARPGVFDEKTPFTQTLLRYTAPQSDLINDMQIILLQYVPQALLQLRALLVKPRSIGWLKLCSRDPHVQPDIQLNLASHPEDVRRLREGARLVCQLMQTASLVDQGANPIILEDGERLSIDELLTHIDQDDWVDNYIRCVVSHYVHPVGTARMGPDGDPSAVVDQWCRVRGVAQLRVVDAAVMPTVPRANTHLTCMMIGERVAGWMQDGLS